jgi:hypothetical protein
MSTITAIDKFRRALATGDHTNMAEIYAPDALIDVNVPEWHFQLQGPQAIEHQLDGSAEARCMARTLDRVGSGR